MIVARCAHACLLGNDKLSPIYAITLSASQLYIGDKFHFPTTPWLLFLENVFSNALHHDPAPLLIAGNPIF